MEWRLKGTYIEAGEFGGGHEQIIIINRAGGTYKWIKVGNRAGWARFVCAVVSGNGWWCGWWWCGRGWWGRRRGAGVGGGGCGVVVVVVVVVVLWRGVTVVQHSGVPAAVTALWLAVVSVA